MIDFFSFSSVIANFHFIKNYFNVRNICNKISVFYEISLPLTTIQREFRLERDDPDLKKMSAFVCKYDHFFSCL